MRIADAPFAIAFAVTLGGCSLLVDTGPYRGGEPDGGRQTDDAQVDPHPDGGPAQVPSAPEVRISPEAPVTTDDLSVEITSESVDPLEAGPVRYRLEWLRGEEAAGIDTDVVSAAETAKGDTWTVRVTPIAADDREGEVATASVTVGNSPSSLASAGLSQYRPIEGEVLEVVTAGLLDPDDDPTNVTCTWLLDGEPVEGESGRQLTLDARFPPGSRIVARVTPRDVDLDEGEPVETGPALVLEDVVRWRQLAPARNGAVTGATAVFYDAPHRRALVIQHGEEESRIWEYAILSGGDRWIELHPSGSAPSLQNPSVVMDEVNRRLLIIGMPESAAGELGPLAVHALELSTRGGERWQPLSPSGTPPSARVLPSVGADPERDRILLYGGMPRSDSAPEELAELVREVHLLEIPGPGFERWTQVELPEPHPALVVGAALIVDASRDRALFVGGAVPTADGLGVVDTISMLDLNAIDDGVSVAPTRLLVPLFGATKFVDAERDRALIAWGLSSLSGGDPPSSEIYALNLESLETSEIEVSAQPASPGLQGFFGPDIEVPGRLIVNTAGGAVNLYATDLRDPETLAFTPIEVGGVTAPGPMRGSVASANRHGLLLFGGSDGEQATDEVWRFGASGWTRLTAAADSMTGRAPEARHAGASIPSFYDAMWVFGGNTDSGETEASAWMLRPTAGTEAQWMERPVPSTDLLPPTNDNASLFELPYACASEGFGLFAGGTSNDVWLFKCNAGGCTWDALEVTGSEPNSRRGAVLSAVGSDVVLFGGDRFNDVWVLDPCASVPAWTAITPSGTAPLGRRDHRMLFVPGDGPDVTRWLVHGGNGGSGLFSNALGDSWMLIREAGEWRWEPLSLPEGEPVPPNRARHALVWDDIGSRALLYGGTTIGFQPKAYDDLWELRFPSP